MSSQTNEDDSTKVYVGGIPYYSSEEDIRSYFESCGTVTEVDCMKFPETGKFRGIAIISFKVSSNILFAFKIWNFVNISDFDESVFKLRTHSDIKSNRNLACFMSNIIHKLVSLLQCLSK